MKKEYNFYVYILTNHERTTFYVGVSNSLVRRIIEHRNGIGSEFTKKYKLKYLVYYESYQYINDALAREKELKKWRREKKINLIKTMNPELKDLSEEILKDFGITEEEEKAFIKELKNIRGLK
jgi:putative endonuclease